MLGRANAFSVSPPPTIAPQREPSGETAAHLPAHIPPHIPQVPPLQDVCRLLRDSSNRQRPPSDDDVSGPHCQLDPLVVGVGGVHRNPQGLVFEKHEVIDALIPIGHRRVQLAFRVQRLVPRRRPAVAAFRALVWICRVQNALLPPQRPCGPSALQHPGALPLNHLESSVHQPVLVRHCGSPELERRHHGHHAPAARQDLAFSRHVEAGGQSPRMHQNSQ
eukprot:3937327-Rhodomonas_salina.1